MALTTLNPNLLGTDSSGASKLSSAGGLVQLHSTGQFTIANTSANNISIANTGAISLTTNTFTVGTAMYSVANGNMGIGTSSPTQPLQINMTTGDQGIKLQAHNTTAGNRLSFADSSGTEYGMVNYDHQSDFMSFYTNGLANERVRIDSSGNVGIGNSTITSADGAAGRIFKVSGPTNTIWVGETTGNGGYNGFIFEARNSNRTNPRFAQIQMQTTSTATDGGLISFSTAATGTGSDITERMRIDSTGRLGIGGTGDNYGLVTINGGLANNSGSVYGLYMKGNGSSTSCPIYFNSEHGYPQKSIYQEGYYMKIRGHNNEGVWILGSYASSDPSVNYKFNGLNNGSTCYNAQNISTWNTTSDRRVKTNIQPLSTALSKIMQLQPVTFDYTDEFAAERGWWLVDEEGNQTTLNPTRQLNNIGFIAQDYKQVFPEDVSISKEKVLDTEYEDFHTLSPDSVVPHLVKAIQELNAKFEEYKASHP